MSQCQASYDVSPRRGQFNKPQWLARIPPELQIEIASYLPCEALARWGQCCKLWMMVTTPTLYKLDAKEGNFAIKWAAFTGTKNNDTMTALAVLRKSGMYSGNVNVLYDGLKIGSTTTRKSIVATPLHYAVASGNLEIVEALLELGASLDIPNGGFLWAIRFLDKQAKSKLNRFDFFTDQRRQCRWLPLLTAFLQNNVDMAELLIQNGASAYVTVGFHETPVHDPQDSISILQFIAADDSPQFEDWRHIFKIFESSVHEVTSRCDGNSVLHTAMSAGNLEGVRLAVNAGIRLEAKNEYGHTALAFAVRELYLADDDRIKDILCCIEQLVESGANINPDGDSVLVHTIGYCTDNPAPCKDIMNLISKFLRQGADINRKSVSGVTAVHEVCNVIMRNHPSSKNNAFLWSLLKELVEQGGDLSITPNLGTSSPLAALMRKGAEPAWLFRYLWKEAGATLRPDEVDEFFLGWCEIPRLQTKSKDGTPRGYDMWRHRPHISQAASHEAYRIAMKQQSPRLYNLLQDIELEEPPMSDLIPIASNKPEGWLWKKIVDSRFATSWVTSRGDSMLHLVVRRFLYEGAGLLPTTYSELAARRDVNALIKRGVDVRHRNTDGQTALDIYQYRLEPARAECTKFLLERALEKAVEKADRESG
ncbi:hypothetical protein QQS21_006877 [Conoideocrella luteorostrata]|uniref:Ankyrin n=1 Tax=Conoideocrella luteorostrata TaxID=1105319 RepID=A0AAJ0CLS7_9HYPO|nr:hypothetical protein QQS21_006877 [Conoideocrella luteorostrata]